MVERLAYPIRGASKRPPDIVLLHPFPGKRTPPKCGTAKDEGRRDAPIHRTAGKRSSRKLKGPRRILPPSQLEVLEVGLLDSHGLSLFGG